MELATYFRCSAGRNTHRTASALEVELAIEKLKSRKSPGIDQIPAELINAGGRTIRGAIHKLYNCYLE